MESQKSQDPRAEDKSCWAKKKTAEESGFIDNFKDHFDEFVNTSMDQHKICLKRTMHDFREYIKLKKATFGSPTADTKGDSGTKESASAPSVEATAAH